MDEADFARKLQAQQNEASAAYRKPVPAIKPVGWCYHCGETLEPGRLFCGADHAEMYDMRSNRR